MTVLTAAETKRQNLVVWSSFLFLTLAWGSSFILVKRGLQAFSPAQVASIRLSVAMLALIGLAVQHVGQIPRARMGYVFLSALLSIFMPAYCFALAQMGISSSIAGVLNALTPSMAFVIGLLFFQQKSNTFKVLGLALGFLGSALLILVNSKGQIALNAYALFVVVATFGYGINVNIVKRYLHDVKPLHLSTVSVAIAGLFAVTYLLSTNWLTILQTAPKGQSAFLAACTLGLLGTAAAQIFFNRMLQLSSAVFASSITYFIPIVAVMWGIWDGEILTFLHLIGIAMIIGGIVILNRFR
jgi:drug/metabolite transporter (DMT)-like permease